MSPESARPGRDLDLEGLRGLCALLVVYGHMTYQAPMLDPGFGCDLLHVDFGPAAVFVFFVISGYVIGLTTRGPFTGPAVRHYCSRRLLRIVPIAWIAVLLSCALVPCKVSTVVGNLLFLQNYSPYPFGIHIPVISNDPPLWSLSYEMLFYALFILIWKHSSRLGAAFALSGAVAFSFEFGVPMMLTRFGAYFVFWLCGLAIAWRTDTASPETRSAWPSAFFGAFSMWRLAPIGSLCGIHPPILLGRDLTPNLGPLDVLLGSLLVVLAATRRAPALQARLTALCAALGLLAVLCKLSDGSLTYMDLLCAAILCACFLGRRWTPAARPLGLLAPVGLVSYALYATAFPLMKMILHSHVLPSGSAATFALRALVFGVLCATVAYLLERVLQPALVRFLASLLGLKREDVPGVQVPPSANISGAER
jgi:peptidoglycan/LPS O-acetylase OafA/YrhL